MTPVTHSTHAEEDPEAEHLPCEMKKETEVTVVHFPEKERIQEKADLKDLTTPQTNTDHNAEQSVAVAEAEVEVL